VLARGSYRIGRGSAAHGYGALDLPAPTGTPVYAVAPGIVSRAMSLAGSYGKHIFLGHAGGRQSRYAHLSSILARTGQMVGAGQMIGRVGSTGNSTGPHLHYEDLINGVRRRPEDLGIFHEGGMSKPGSFAQFDPYKPEAVLTSAQWSAVEQAATRPVQVSADVRVFVGDREITDIVRTEITVHDRDLNRRVSAGSGRAR
jgi:murein DD-endopeptidase MepM/ murein hydrolase activator NlpD